MRRRRERKRELKSADSRAAEAREGGAGRALLRRRRPAGPGRGNRRLRRAIRSRWRASAATTRRRRWSSPACASWARPPRSCRPEKRVLMPDLDATCSLDLGCPADEFAAFCDAHPDRTVVVYANTSAAVKARADWMVTSSMRAGHRRATCTRRAKRSCGRRTGTWAATSRSKTGADMLIWKAPASCTTSSRASSSSCCAQQHPDAKVLVHPESPEAVVALADAVGSTSQLIDAAVRAGRAASSSSPPTTASCTRCGTPRPGKTFIEAPTAGNSATCKSCAHCPWMAMNGLREPGRRAGDAATTRSSSIRRSARARVCRSTACSTFAARHKKRVQASGDLAKDGALFSNVGAA